MNHDQFMQAMIKLDQALCRLLLLGKDTNPPLSPDIALESIVGPDTASHEGLTAFHEIDAAKIMSAVDLIGELEDYDEMRERLWITFV